MNDLSAPAPAESLLPDSISLFTSVHFLLIALFALLAVAIILIGVMRKRRRKEADAALEERIEQADIAHEPAPPEPLVGTPVAAESAYALTQLKGLGPKVALRLNELGIASVPQLAALDDVSAARIDAQLGTFAGRLARDRWVEQARFLTADDRAGFEARFGNL